MRINIVKNIQKITVLVFVLFFVFCGQKLTPKCKRQLEIFKKGAVQEKVNIAKTETLCDAVIDVIFSDTNEVLFQALASNPNLSLKTQLKLFKVESVPVQIFLARNKNLSPEVQKKFLKHLVSVSLATNTNLDINIQKELLKDTVDVRYVLAGNGHIDKSVLQILAKDSVPLVRCAVAGNPAIDEEIQISIAQDTDTTVLKALAGNKAITVLTQKYISENAPAEVVDVLRKNPSLDMSVKYGM